MFQPRQQLVGCIEPRLWSELLSLPRMVFTPADYGAIQPGARVGGEEHRLLLRSFCTQQEKKIVDTNKAHPQKRKQHLNGLR